MHAADFVLPPSIMKQDDLSSQGRRWIRPNSREIRPPETPIADFESVAERPRPTACYVMGYVEESERIPNIWCCTKDKLLFLRIPLTPNEVHILSRYHCRIAGAVGWSCDYRHLQFQDRAALFLTFRTLASHQRLWKFYNKM
ncbi:predicted protein [Histoplasma capsulatum H143]|uniref:Uncharacterized protein n=1 Tax=Ajellomyces capsulatus (strain H143) TaxID=544712 RepID=C6HPU7_AJECH|nr:predicted protein [Histoplasma capsulatum H143]